MGRVGEVRKAIASPTLPPPPNASDTCHLSGPMQLVLEDFQLLRPTTRLEIGNALMSPLSGAFVPWVITEAEVTAGL